MNQILNEDCVNATSKMDNNSIDLCITSPPYKNKNNYSDELMTNSFKQIYRVLKNNTLFFLNFGSLAEDKYRPFRVCQLAINENFFLNDTIIWVKNHYKPIQGSKRLNNLTEFIFILYKGKMPKLNRLAIGVPYVDITNAKRFNGGNNLHCGGNVWYINYPTINKSDQKLHNDRFPEELSDRCIKLCGYDVQTVLDPYCSSETVGISCKKLGKDFIGIDIKEEYVKLAEGRINSFIVS